MSTAQSVVEIRGDTTSLRSELDASIRALAAFAQSVDTTNKTAVAAFRDSAAAEMELHAAVGATTAQTQKLGAVMQTFEDRISSADRTTNMATERMARGFMSVAHSGDIASRGMGTIIAAASDLAFSFGAGGPLLGAVAIAGLAFTEFWEKQQADARKAIEVESKYIEALYKAGDISKINQDTGERSGNLKDAQAELDRLKALQKSQPMDADESGSDPLQAQIDDQERLVGTLSQRIKTNDLMIVQTRQLMALEDQEHDLVDRLSTAKQEALRLESELVKANADHNAAAAIAARTALEQTLGTVNTLADRLRAFHSANTDSLLGENNTRVLHDLNIEMDKFHVSLDALGNRDVVQAAVYQVDQITKAMDGVVASIEKADEKAEKFKASLAKHSDGDYGFAASQGFGQALGDGAWVGFLKAWEQGVKTQGKEFAHSKTGQQITRPIGMDDSGANDPGIQQSRQIQDTWRWLPQFFRGDAIAAVKDFKAESDKVLSSLSNPMVQALDVMKSATDSMISKMIAAHKLGVKEIKKALGEPIVAKLESEAKAFAVEGLGDAAAGNFGGAALWLAAAAAATVAASEVGSLMGAGGSGGSGASGGSGSGNSSSSSRHNSGAALADRRDQPMQLEVIITQKDPTGRQVAQQRQMLQRLSDRNAPTRVAL